jgi:replication factor A2
MLGLESCNLMDQLQTLNTLPCTGMDYQGMYAGGSHGGHDGGYMDSHSYATNDRPNSSGGAGGGARRAYDQQTMVPVTIRMILESQALPDDTGTAANLQLKDGRPLHQVRLVAAIRKQDDMSTNVLYEVEDGTGLIEVKKWVDDNVCSALHELQQECKQEHIFVKIVGQVKDYNGKKMILADSIRRLKTGNEVAHHFLEVVYSAQKNINKNSYVHAPPSMWNQGAASSAMAMSANHGQSSGNTLRDQLMRIIRTEGEMSEAGASVQQCRMGLGNKYTESDVRKEMHALAAEGILYSTIDDNHYKLAM